MPTKIFIIEDNPTNLELMTFLLNHAGYEISSALDGNTAIENLKHEKPDLIICDIQMPGMNGYEVIKYLKAKQEFVNIPIIAVTAFAMVGDKDKILMAGYDGYIDKPIEPQIFASQVATFLPESKRVINNHDE